MADKISDEDDFDEEAVDEDLDDYDAEEQKLISFKDSAAARRRLEQIKEERALERLLKGDFDDWD
jgi:hypothetical protein